MIGGKQHEQWVFPLSSLSCFPVDVTIAIKKVACTVGAFFALEYSNAFLTAQIALPDTGRESLKPAQIVLPDTGRESQAYTSHLGFAVNKATSIHACIRACIRTYTLIKSPKKLRTNTK
jgi:hypothetical protein